MDSSTPERTRADEGDGRWISALAVSLITNRGPVEAFLSKAKQFGAFQDRIAAWNQQYPGAKPSDVRAKAHALVAIVQDYGIQGLVMATEAGDPPTREAVRTGGAVRTRGGVKSVEPPHALMERVAAAYGRPS